ITKAALAFGGEDLANAATQALLEQSVRVHETPPQTLRQQSSDRRFTGAAITDQKDQMGRRKVHPVFPSPAASLRAVGVEALPPRWLEDSPSGLGSFNRSRA